MTQEQREQREQRKEEPMPEAVRSGRPGVRRYTVLIVPDPEGRGYTALMPTLPGCLSSGDTVEETIANAREAIELYLETLSEREREVAWEDGEPAGTAVVTVDVAPASVAPTREPVTDAA